MSIAKAIAIICMVIGHSWDHSSLGKGANLFDMTLFFLMAGFCFKDSYLYDFRLFLRKRISGLWWPFVKWGVIAVLLHNLFIRLGIYGTSPGYGDCEVSTLDSLYTTFMHIVSTILFIHMEQLLGAYWFLRELFVASIIAYITIRYISNRLIGGGILLIIALLFNIIELRIPYALLNTSSFMGGSFFVIGTYLRQINIDERMKKFSTFTFVSVVTLILIVIAWVYAPLDMASMYVGFVPTWRMPLFWLYSIVFSIFVYRISITLNSCDSIFIRILVYIGNNTLTILTFHFLAFKLTNAVFVYALDLPKEEIGWFPTNTALASQGWWLFYAVCGVIGPILVKFIIEKIKVQLIIKN